MRHPDGRPRQRHTAPPPDRDATFWLLRRGCDFGSLRSTLEGIREFRFGTQSWTSFPDWVGVFYPPKMPQAEALSFYGQVFDTVEVNATFHALPTDSTVRGWYERTGPDFSFALKCPRQVTHDVRLELPAAEAPMLELLRLAGLLEDKLRPLLVQLPPSFDRSAANRRSLAAFLDFVQEASSARMAIELRHPSWATPDVQNELALRNVAWVLTDGDQPNHRSVLYSADFTYVRWNRSGLPFSNWREIQHDRSADLDWWAATLREAPVETVFGYMSNEFAGHAPASLAMLKQRLQLPVSEAQELWQQRALF